LFVYFQSTFFYSDLSTANGNKPPNNSQQGGNAGNSGEQPLRGAEHDNKGTKNKANEQRHQKGQATKRQDQLPEGEKGDKSRDRQNIRRGGAQDGQTQTATERRTERRTNRNQDEANKADKKTKKEKVKSADDVMKDAKKGKLSKNELKRLKKKQKDFEKGKIFTGKTKKIKGGGFQIVKKAKKLKRFCKGPLRPLGWCLLILTLPSEVRAHGVGGTIARNTPLLGEAIEIDECLIDINNESRKNKIRERIRISISRSRCEQLIRENNLQPVEDQSFDEQYFNEFLRGIKHSMENERKNNTQQHVSPKPRGHMSVTPARATDNVVLERYDDFEGDRRMNLDINKDISTSSSNIRVNNTAFENTETKYDVGTRYNSNSEISINSYESAVNNNMNGLETQTQTSYPVYNEYDSSYTDKQVNVESIRKFKESYNK